jgi:hypothetical protein
MSASEKINVKCPECEEEQPATVWRTLDAANDPGIREALFAWEINVFVCQKCSLRAQLPVGLRYVDHDKHFSVQYYPVDFLGNDDFYDKFQRNGEPADSAPGDNEEKAHIVFDMAEMIRYIAFREIVFEKGAPH